MKRTSLILTVLNEQKSIRKLLETVDKQSLMPDEVVIVDAGSSDSTIAIINEWIGNTRQTVQLTVEEGANISRGRNVAISAAKNEIIVVTDGGCELTPEWIEKISAPIRNGSAQVVYGGTVAKGSSIVGRLFAHFYFAKTHRSSAANTDHSSRSVAFLKSIWESVGGYPEWLTLAGEDTLFFIELDKATTGVVERDAEVYWRHGAETLRGIYKMHRRNSIGSGEALMWPKLNALLIGLYLVGITALLVAAYQRNAIFIAGFTLLFVLLWSRQTVTVLRMSRDPRGVIVMPVIVAVRDIGMVNGYLSGLRNRLTSRQS